MTPNSNVLDRIDQINWFTRQLAKCNINHCQELKHFQKIIYVAGARHCAN